MGMRPWADEVYVRTPFWPGGIIFLYHFITKGNVRHTTLLTDYSKYYAQISLVQQLCINIY
jgi:hypothetical protein